MEEEVKIRRMESINMTFAARTIRNLVDPDVDSIKKACYGLCNINTRAVIKEIIDHYNNKRITCDEIHRLSCSPGIKDYFYAYTTCGKTPEFEFNYSYAKLITSRRVGSRLLIYVLNTFKDPLKCAWIICWSTSETYDSWLFPNHPYEFLRRHYTYDQLLESLQPHQYSISDEECIARHVLYNRTDRYWLKYTESTDYPVNNLFKMLKLTQWTPATHRRFRCRQRYEIELILLVMTALRKRSLFCMPTEMVLKICGMVSHCRDGASRDYIVTGQIKNRLLAV